MISLNRQCLVSDDHTSSTGVAATKMAAAAAANETNAVENRMLREGLVGMLEVVLGC